MISTTGPSSKTDRKKGFTLLELLLVMLLFAATAAVIAPSLALFKASRAVLNLSAQFVALTDYARSQAISEGRVYCLNVDSGKGSFWLTAQENGNFERIGKEMGREFVLLEGMDIKLAAEPYIHADVLVSGLRLPGQMAVVDAVEGREEGINTIKFSPDGHIQPAAFRMSDRRNNVVEIVCASPSGRFKIAAAEGG